MVVFSLVCFLLLLTEKMWSNLTSIFSVASDFRGYSAGKESICNAGDLGSIPGLGRYPEEGNSYPLQYSALENSMDCIVHGVAKSPTRLSGFHFLPWVLTSMMNNKASPSKIKQLPTVSSRLHFQFVGYSNLHVILIYINYLWLVNLSFSHGPIYF